MASTREMSFSEEPHPKCKASQEALREDGFKSADNCPSCLRLGVECMVGCHPLKVELETRVQQSAQRLQERSGEVAAQQEPHPRQPKWDKINSVLGAKRKRGDSTPYSSAKWSELVEIFKPEHVNFSTEVQLREDVAQLALSYLRLVAQCFTPGLGKEAKRLYFISPIIVAVCAHFNGDVKIDVEEDLNGKRVDVNGHFEMILSRGDKKVMIVEAKKEDFDQGKVQCCLGCEVAADLGNLSEVYGLVTNFVEWNLIKTEASATRIEVVSLDLREFVPIEASFRNLTSKLVTLLTNA